MNLESYLKVHNKNLNNYLPIKQGKFQKNLNSKRRTKNHRRRKNNKKKLTLD
jgi:hypothetical protein